MGAKRLHIWVSGRVQGVFYRATAVQVAQSLGLSGWVRNLPDGRVEIVAEGDESALQEFRRWCGQGPAAARVDQMEVKEESASGELTGFSVRS